MLVSQAPASAFGDPHAFAAPAQIGQQPFAAVVLDAVDEGSDRHGHDQVLGAAPGLVRSRARLAGLGREVLLEAKLDQRAQLRDGFEDDVAAAPPVAAGRTAFGDVLLAPPGHDAVAAAAAADRDRRFVYKLQGARRGIVSANGPKTKRARRLLGRPRGRRTRTCYASASTWTCLRLRFSLNWTRPATSAKSVLSLPMPTPSPG